MNKKFLRKTFCLLVVLPIGLYAPAKQNPKAENAKSAPKSSKKLKDEDRLLDEILNSDEHINAIELSLLKKYNNFTQCQKNKARQLLSMMNTIRANPDDRECQKMFDFIMTISDPAVLNIQFKGGQTILMFAAELGFFRMVDHLLKKKADPNLVTFHNVSALIFAAQNNHKDIVELLLQQNNLINIDQKDCRQYTALFSVLGVIFRNKIHKNDKYQNGMEIIKKLLEHGANPNAADDQGSTALLFAAQEECFDLVKLLLTYGADPNISNSYDDTPFMHAINKGNVDIVQLLINFNANINKANKKGKAPLLVAVKKNDISLVKKLLSRNANSLLKDDEDKTALMLSVEVEDLDIMKLVLNYEAKNKDKDAVNRNKLYALNLAVDLDCQEKIKLLLQSGIPLKVLANGVTPLFNASFYEDLELIKMLIDHGFPVNAQDHVNQETALMLAASENRLDTVKVLLEAGADPFLKNSSGQTALSVAQKQGYKKVVRVLNAFMLKQKNRDEMLKQSYQRWLQNHQIRQCLVKQSIELVVGEQQKDVNFASVGNPDDHQRNQFLRPSPVINWNDGWQEKDFMRARSRLGLDK